MCDPHSEPVQCSISPLCVSVWRHIHLLQQASSAHLESIYPQCGAMILHCGIFSFVTVAKATYTWRLLLFPAPVFSLKHPPQPHTLLTQEQLAVDTILSTFLIASSLT